MSMANYLIVDNSMFIRNLELEFQLLEMEWEDFSWRGKFIGDSEIINGRILWEKESEKKKWDRDKEREINLLI